MASTTISDIKVWTYREYAALDDGKRYEVHEGELVMAPSPAFEHQDLLSDLLSIFKQAVDGKRLGKMIVAPFDVILDERNIVQPDLVFVSERNRTIIRSEGIFGSPDLVVEILSPSSIVRDRYTKRSLYGKFRIPEYWIVDWKNSAIEVLSLSDAGYELFSSAAGSGKAASKAIPGLMVDVAEVMKAAGR